MTIRFDNWRIWVLMTIGFISFVLLVAEPSSEENWFESFLLIKGIGIITLGFTFGLAAAWIGKFDDNSDKFV